MEQYYVRHMWVYSSQELEPFKATVGACSARQKVSIPEDAKNKEKDLLGTRTE